MKPKTTSYRIYADDTIVHEDDWDEWDNAQPYYDDYAQYDIPDVLIDHIAGS